MAAPIRAPVCSQSILPVYPNSTSVTTSISSLLQPRPLNSGRLKLRSKLRSIIQAGKWQIHAVSTDEVVGEQEKEGEAVKESETVLTGCKTCGRAELQKGCNGDGRIQGGIGAIPGFTWWPIKAYRPCPGLVESGGKYKRLGQNMDEVAFGSKAKD